MEIRCRHIDHVQVCVPPGGEERAREFYEQVLGFRAVEKPESLRGWSTMWMQNGDIELHVATDGELARTKQHPAIAVEDIGAVRAHLVQAGVAIHEEPVIADRERFSFLDPFGNRIEFLEYVKDRRIGK